MKKRELMSVMVASAISLGSLVGVNADDQDNDGFNDDVTWSPALPGPGQVPQANCNGFVTKTTTYTARCEPCTWVEDWNPFDDCECDLTRTKDSDQETFALTWTSAGWTVGLHASAAADVPVGGVITETAADGTVTYKIEKGSCTLDSQGV